VPQNGRLREIPQKVQKLAAHRSLASGEVGRIGPALAGKACALEGVSTSSNEARCEIDEIRLKRRKLHAPHKGGISPRPILMFTPRPAGQLVPSFIVWMAEMAEDLKTLIAIQDWVLKCRRLASETPDPETAVLFLFHLIETKVLRASPTSEFSHSLDPKRTLVLLIAEPG
jgi:hypothetical protein